MTGWKEDKKEIKEEGRWAVYLVVMGQVLQNRWSLQVLSEHNWFQSSLFLPPISTLQQHGILPLEDIVRPESSCVFFDIPRSKGKSPNQACLYNFISQWVLLLFCFPPSLSNMS